MLTENIRKKYTIKFQIYRVLSQLQFRNTTNLKKNIYQNRKNSEKKKIPTLPNILHRVHDISYQWKPLTMNTVPTEHRSLDFTPVPPSPPQLLQGGQDPGEPHATRDDGLAAAPEQRVQGVHGQAGRPVYERYGGAADDARGRRGQHAHQQDGNGEELAEFVLPQRQEGHESGDLEQQWLERYPINVWYQTNIKCYKDNW